MAIDIAHDDTGNSSFQAGTVIKVIGVGGGGGNAVAHMQRSDVKGIEFVCANTDSQDLNRREDCTIIQLGHTGLGAGSNPEVGRQLTAEAEDKIREALDGANLLFITAGMGGGTGTGGAPIIARIAREMNILTIAIVTKPFEFEGAMRTQYADDGLAELEANVDALIVVLNEKLLQIYPEDVSLSEAFGYADNVLKNAVSGISDIINVKGHMNVDFNDVRTVMSHPGKALMGIASAEGPDRATVAAQEAIACPLLEGIDVKNAKGLLVVISAAENTFKLNETRKVMQVLESSTSDKTITKVGTVYDDSMGDKLSVTVVATGLGDEKAEAEAEAEPQHFIIRRTGTDDMPATADALAPQQPQLADAPFLSNNPSDYNQGMQVPAYIRNPRSSVVNPAAADSKISALQSGGMQEIDIPAYLRKQAD